MSRVTRFEVIDDNGRVLTRYPKEISLSYQDEGRTLKVFLRGHRPDVLKAQASGLAWALKEMRRRLLRDRT